MKLCLIMDYCYEKHTLNLGVDPTQNVRKAVTIISDTMEAPSGKCAKNI